MISEFGSFSTLMTWWPLTARWLWITFLLSWFSNVMWVSSNWKFHLWVWLLLTHTFWRTSGRLIFLSFLFSNLVQNSRFADIELNLQSHHQWMSVSGSHIVNWPLSMSVGYGRNPSWWHRTQRPRRARCDSNAPPWICESVPVLLCPTPAPVKTDETRFLIVNNHRVGNKNQ